MVLCAPFGQESLRAHRAFRQLGLRLARVGLHVLRFDYFGCGDSAGESDDGDAAQWMADVATAADELKRSQRLEATSLVGLRIGATLAALAASRRSDIDSLVLWQPVLEGKAYLQEEWTAHADWLARRTEALGPAKLDGERPQILGFPLTEAMRASIGELNLLGLRKRPARRVLLIERDPAAGARRLEGHLANLDVEVHYRCVAEPAIWKRVGMDQPVVPRETLDCIAAWLDEAVR